MDISESLISTLQFLVNNNHITKEMIVNHRIANEHNLHSKLIYAAQKAFENLNLTPFSEIKLKLIKPIDLEFFGVTRNTRTQYQWQYKCDVAAFLDNKLECICEVFTMDMVSHHLPSKTLKAIYNKTNWVTSADKIKILLDEENKLNPINFYILSVLPEKAKVYPSYPDVKSLLSPPEKPKNVFQIIEPHVNRLLSDISDNCKTVTRIILTENGVWYNEKFNKIKY